MWIMSCDSWLRAAGVVLALSSVTSAAQLPSTFKVCKKTDPKLLECIKNAIQSAIPDVVPGLPKFGILPIDPLAITELKMTQDSGPVSLNMVFTNCEISGFAAAVVDSVKFDPFVKNSELECDLHIPRHVNMTADYNIHGKVLLVPIQEKGKCRISFGPMKARILLKTVEYVDKGENYIKVDDYQFRFDTESTKFTFTAQGDSSKRVVNLSDFANENSKLIIDELKPVISKSLGTVFKSISNKIFTKVPYKYIFP